MTKCQYFFKKSARKKNIFRFLSKKIKFLNAERLHFHHHFTKKSVKFIWSAYKSPTSKFASMILSKLSPSSSSTSSLSGTYHQLLPTVQLPF